MEKFHAWSVITIAYALVVPLMATFELLMAVSVIYIGSMIYLSVGIEDQVERK